MQNRERVGLRTRGWGRRGHSVTTDLLCKRLWQDDPTIRTSHAYLSAEMLLIIVFFLLSWRWKENLEKKSISRDLGANKIHSGLNGDNWKKKWCSGREMMESMAYQIRLCMSEPYLKRRVKQFRWRRWITKWRWFHVWNKRELKFQFFLFLFVVYFVSLNEILNSKSCTEK